MTALPAALLCAVALSACGQKGPLYLPDQTSEVVTRPTQTVPETTTGDAPSPAPEASAPDSDKDKKKPGTAPPPR